MNSVLPPVVDVGLEAAPVVGASIEVKRGGINIEKLHTIADPWEPPGASISIFGAQMPDVSHQTWSWIILDMFLASRHWSERDMNMTD